VRNNDGTRLLPLAFAAAVTLAACGGSSASHSTHAVTQQSASPATVAPQKDYSNYYPPGTHRATPAQVRAINGWANELRAGHVRKATDWFDIPVIMQNASPVTRLRSRHAVFEFNDTLPCGAHVVKVIAGKTYAVATFVLTERPRAATRCGATGKLAAVAFRLRHGKIDEWRRVLVPPPLGPARNLKGAIAAT
jgi:hypothetical protein